jgi:hypothetical protein
MQTWVTASVTNASQYVIVQGDVTATVLINSIFMVVGSYLPYFVSVTPTYDALEDETTVTLTGNYQEATNATASAVFSIDFTTPDALPMINKGDAGAGTLFNIGMMRVQAVITDFRMNYQPRLSYFSYDDETETVSLTNLIVPGTIRLTGAGTVAAPIISVGETNTGLYRSSAGVLDVAASGARIAQFVHVSSAVNYVRMTAGATGNGAFISAMGSDTHVPLTLQSQGTSSSISFAPNSVLQAYVFHTASAVNYVAMTGAASGNAPRIVAAGAAANISLEIGSRGTGSVFVRTNNGAQIQAAFLHTASANRYVTITGSQDVNPTIGVSAGSLAISAPLIASSSAQFMGSLEQLVANSGYINTNTGASDKQWRLGGSSSGQFGITEVGVADRFIIAAGGAATLTGTLSATGNITTGSGDGAFAGLTAGQLGVSGYGGIWGTAVTPSTTNYALASNGSFGILNGTNTARLAVNGLAIADATSTGLAVTGTLTTTGNVDTANGFGYRWGTGAVQIYSNGTYLRARTNSVDRIELTDAGLAVTGTLSAQLLNLDATVATVYDATSDDGQVDALGLNVTNQSEVVGSFSQINLRVSGASGRAVARLVAIRTASATSDLAVVLESSNTKFEAFRFKSDRNIEHFANNNGYLNTNTGASNKQWRLGGGSSGQFGITEVGVADRFIIAAGGVATLTGNLSVSGYIDTTDVYANGGWFRNTGLTGLYNSTYTKHFYADSDWSWAVGGDGSGNAGLKLRSSHAGTVYGYLYGNVDGVGILRSDGNWGLRIPGTTGSLQRYGSGGPYTIWDEANDGAGSGLDADLLDGLQPAATNTVSTIMSRDSSGNTALNYLTSNWIYTTSGNSGIGSDITRIYCTYTGDGYIRYLDKAEFKVLVGLPYTTWDRRDMTTDSTYWNGSTGWSGWGPNDLPSYGSCFFDVWGGSNFPSGTSHIHGFQALHHTQYGLQIGGQYSQNGTIFTRAMSAGSWGAWQKIWTEASDGAGSGLDADTLDGYQGSTYVGQLGNTYYQVNTWLQLNGHYGLYCPTINSAHFYPNASGTYGTWQINGSRNGHTGIYFNDSGMTLMMNSASCGFYRQSVGWHFYVESGEGYLWTDSRRIITDVNVPVQSIESVYDSVTTGTSIIPSDDTVPQNTEGTEILTATITPRRAGSKILITAMGWGSLSVSANIKAALFLNSDASAVATTDTTVPAANYATPFVVRYQYSPGSTSAITVRLRFGCDTGTWTINGSNGGRLHGASSRISLTVQEIPA